MVTVTRCFVAVVMLLITVAGCSDKSSQPEVVVYTSVDQVYSEPVLRAFEKASGIRVLPVYDVEASKTTGLVNRLIAEKNNPQADVFWNGEFAQTLLLKEQGVLASYQSPHHDNVSSSYKDAEDYWTGFGGRARVMIVNRDNMHGHDYPESLDDFINGQYPTDQLAIANPVFGTTATHAAALYSLQGRENTLAWFRRLQDAGVNIVNGNSVVRDMAAQGQIMFGMTDTDDAMVAIKQGRPVDIVFPDQQSHGTLLVPNTVALINKAPNTENARRFIDFLLSDNARHMMFESGWMQLSVDGVPAKALSDHGITSVKLMNVSLADIQQNIEQARQDLSGIFIR